MTRQLLPRYISMPEPGDDLEPREAMIGDLIQWAHDEQVFGQGVVASVNQNVAYIDSSLPGVTQAVSFQNVKYFKNLGSTIDLPTEPYSIIRPPKDIESETFPLVLQPDGDNLNWYKGNQRTAENIVLDLVRSRGWRLP